MIYCDRCEKPIEPHEDDGFMPMVGTSTASRECAGLILEEVGSQKLTITIAALTTSHVTPDCGYHYHEDCFAGLVAAALTDNYTNAPGGIAER